MKEISPGKPLLGRTPSADITEQDLWRDVSRALHELAEVLGQSALLAYMSRQHDERELALVANGLERKVTPVVMLASSGDVGVLSRGDIVTVPDELHLLWLEPQHFFGADRALLLGRQTAVGRLLVLVLPYSSDNQPLPAAVATLKNFFHDELVAYIEVAWVTVLQPRFVRGGSPVALTAGDAFYLSAVTITTLGYGDITPSPSSGLAKLLVATEAVLGIILVGMFVALLLQTLYLSG